MTARVILDSALQHHYAGRFEEALAAYRRVVELAPNAEEAKLAKQQIQNLTEVWGARGTGTGAGWSDEHRRSGTGQPRPRNEANVVFPCVRCRTPIRLGLPSESPSFRCPRCQHSYEVLTASAEPFVGLLIPAAIPIVDGRSWEAARAYPEPVVQAFGQLGLQPTDDLDAVKRRYRELVGQYHPDKVSHLGPELRRLAETKTAELVLSFEKIAAFLRVARP